MKIDSIVFIHNLINSDLEFNEILRILFWKMLNYLIL